MAFNTLVVKDSGLYFNDHGLKAHSVSVFRAHIICQKNNSEILHHWLQNTLCWSKAQSLSAASVRLTDHTSFYDQHVHGRSREMCTLQSVTTLTFFTVTPTELHWCVFKWAGSWLTKLNASWHFVNAEWMARNLTLTWELQTHTQSSSSSVFKCHYVFLVVSENSSRLMYANPLLLFLNWFLFHQLSWPFWSRTMERITMTMSGMTGEKKRGGGGWVWRWGVESVCGQLSHEDSDFWRRLWGGGLKFHKGGDGEQQPNSNASIGLLRC